MLEYLKATRNNLEEIYELVRDTVRTVYPKYYPQEIVDFFCGIHNRESIQKDIEDGRVWILVDHGQLIGTGSYKDNHITRVYVNPLFQGQGNGSYIMQSLENIIAIHYEFVELDASLPAISLYKKRGYMIQKQEKWICENDVVLSYEVMRKRFDFEKETNNCENT